MAYRKIDIDAFDEDRFLEDEDLLTSAPSAGEDEGAVKANLTNVEYNKGQTAADAEKLADGSIAEARSFLQKYFNSNFTV